jgi:hypothetical protein
MTVIIMASTVRCHMSTQCQQQAKIYWINNLENKSCFKIIEINGGVIYSVSMLNATEYLKLKIVVTSV